MYRQLLQHDAAVNDCNDVINQLHMRLHSYNDMPVAMLNRDWMQRHNMQMPSVIINNVAARFKFAANKINNLIDQLL